MLRLQSALRRSGRLLQPRGAHRCLAERPLEALLPTHVRNLLGTTPPPEKVFANRELRMADVKAIGFDYDYTPGVLHERAQCFHLRPRQGTPHGAVALPRH